MMHDELKSTEFLGMRASDVLRKHKKIFLKNFALIEKSGIAKNLRVTGSVARNRDTEESDIDFIVDAKDDSMDTWCALHEALSDWIKFPIHIIINYPGLILPNSVLHSLKKVEEI